VRSLKVYPKHRSNTWSEVHVPEIRLCGNWLEKLGFGIDNRVTITTMPGLLIVRVDDDQTGLPY
jgi:toxic protein SymE